MTGIAIVIYLNQKPFEPRERDYAYAGSFYAYCIWLGMGVAGLWTLLKKVLPEGPSAIVVTLVTLLIPIQMAGQNWDDHDRSGRYTMRDFGMNYLRTCEKDAILFTNGDNDTFPLWYAQEVEGFRTDVRVCNLSYLQTDWYVDQMRRESYDSPPLPITWTKDRYIGDKGLYAYVLSKEQMDNAIRREFEREMGDNWMNRIQSEQGLNFGQYYDQSAYKDTMSLDEVMEILKTKDNYTPRNPFNITEGVIIPSNKLSLPINTEAVDWKSFNATPRSEMIVDLGNKSVLYRNDIMVLEMLNNVNKDNWKRPMYYAVTVGTDMYMNLTDQFTLEGINYRITPGRIHPTRVNTDVMFDNMVNKYKWGGIENPNVYLDQNNLRMCRTFRMMFSQLIVALIDEGKHDKALQALDACLEKIPPSTVPLEGEGLTFADAYYRLGKTEKALELLKTIEDRAQRSINWYNRLTPQQMANASYDITNYFDILLNTASVYYRNGQPEKYNEIMSKLFGYSQMYFSSGVGRLGDYTIKEITDDAIQNYYYGKDTTLRDNVELMIQQSFGLMQKFSPQLFKEYMQQ